MNHLETFAQEIESGDDTKEMLSTFRIFSNFGVRNRAGENSFIKGFGKKFDTL